MEVESRGCQANADGDVSAETCPPAAARAAYRDPGFALVPAVTMRSKSGGLAATAPPLRATAARTKMPPPLPRIGALSSLCGYWPGGEDLLNQQLLDAGSEDIELPAVAVRARPHVAVKHSL